MFVGRGVRRVIGRYGVHHAGSESVDAGLNIGPRAQRWVDFGGGVVTQFVAAAGDGRVIEPEVMRRDLGGHPHAARARAIHRLQRGGGGEMAAVQRCAGRLGQRDIALDDAQFRHRGLSAQPQPRRNHAVVHHTARREPRILAVFGERNIEIREVFKRPPCNRRVGHGVAVVAHRHRARVAHRRQLG